MPFHLAAVQALQAHQNTSQGAGWALTPLEHAKQRHNRPRALIEHKAPPVVDGDQAIVRAQ